MSLQESARRKNVAAQTGIDELIQDTLTHMHRETIVLLLWMAGHLLAAANDLPLHRRIDQLVSMSAPEQSSSIADDAEFFRRLNLDLAGSIPTAEETRQFLHDTSANKRTAAIDRLLNAPQYVDRMTDLFQIMLMEQRGTHPEWERFLKDCFERNRPWNEIAQDILMPLRDDETKRGAAFFYTKRLDKVGENPTDYPGLTRDVGRLFLGIDLQCAECHDHLFIDDYTQQEFQGLLAVYLNLSIRRESFPAINEKTMVVPLQYTSVFESQPQQTGPRVPFGQEFTVPEPPPEDPSTKKKRPDPNETPTYSALDQVSQSLVSSDSQLFRQNIANRIWFLFMGEGLVEPLDQFHSENPSTHPELLDLLSQEFASHDFDLKWLIREILLSNTWQRTSQNPEVSSEEISDEKFVGDLVSRWRRARQRNLSPEQLFLSTLQATGNLERLRPALDEEPTEAFDQLRDKFTTAFALEPKEPAYGYVPSVKEAIFLLNDSDLLDLLRPHPGNLMERLLSLHDTDVPDELYLHVFTRIPNPQEREFIITYLGQNPDERSMALRQLVWGMLSSIEFRLNH